MMKLALLTGKRRALESPGKGRRGKRFYSPSSPMNSAILSTIFRALAPYSIVI